MKKCFFGLWFFLFSITFAIAQTQTTYPVANSLSVISEEQFGKIAPNQSNLYLIYSASGWSIWKMRPNDRTSPASTNIRVHPTLGIRFERISLQGAVSGGSSGGNISVSQIADLANIYPPKWIDIAQKPDLVTNLAMYLGAPYRTFQSARLNTQTDISAFYITNRYQEGLYVLKPGDFTSADDTAQVIKDATNRRFIRVYEGPANIEWFRRSSDNNSMFQKAFASGVKSFVLRENAQYDITNEISVPSGISIDLRGATIRQLTPDKNGFVVSSSSNVKIVNGTIKAGYWIAANGAFTFEKNNAIYGQDAKNVTIQRITVRNWGSCGIQAKRCWNWNVLDNEFYGMYIINNSVAHCNLAFTSSYAESPAGYKGGGHLIRNNRFFSNTRIGAYANLDGGEKTSSWEGNHVVPSDTLGNPLPLNQVVTLHGLAEAYTYADGQAVHSFLFNTIENTSATGIYAPGAVSGAVVGSGVNIIGNVLKNIGHYNGGLSSAIHAGCAHRFVNISYNVIDNYLSTYGESGAIRLNQQHGADSTTVYQSIVSYNVITNSAQHGIVGSGQYTTIAYNQITNSAFADILWTTGQDFVHKGINIVYNTIKRTVAGSHPFIYTYFEDNKGGFSPVNISNNVLLNLYSRQATGILCRTIDLIAKGNHFVNFDIGIYFNKNFSGVVRRFPNISDNYFEKCFHAIDYLGSIASNSIFVVGVNRIVGHTAKYVNQSTGVNECLVEVSDVRPDGDISFQATSNPSVGTFQAGDRYYYPNPTTAALGKVYTGSSWVEF